MAPESAAQELSPPPASPWTDRATRLPGGTWRSRGFRLAVLSALLIGTWLRLRGYILDRPTLWLDKALWCVSP